MSAIDRDGLVVQRGAYELSDQPQIAACDRLIAPKRIAKPEANDVKAVPLGGKPVVMIGRGLVYALLIDWPEWGVLGHRSGLRPSILMTGSEVDCERGSYVDNRGEKGKMRGEVQLEIIERIGLCLPMPGPAHAVDDEIGTVEQRRQRPDVLNPLVHKRDPVSDGSEMGARRRRPRQKAIDCCD
jgi:hypothetical protein